MPLLSKGVTMHSEYHESILGALRSCGACSAEQVHAVETLLGQLNGECATDGPKIWRHITRHILLPSHDFPLHLRLAALVYGGWATDMLGRPPLWLPEPDQAAGSNIGRFLQSLRDETWWQEVCRRGSGAGAASPLTDGSLHSPADLLLGWRLLQRASWEQPEEVWPAVFRALRLRFDVPPKRMLQRHPSNPDLCRWLPGARFNVAACALASPLAPAAAPALLWARDGAPTQLVAISREELRQRVRHLAACIRSRFKQGDALALYLPMTPDAVCLYLAAVLAGCVVVSVADSFSGAELRTRLDIARAVGVFTQDVVLRGGKALPLFEKVVQSGTGATAVVLPASEEESGMSPSAPPLRPGDLPWSSFCRLAGPAEAAALQPHVADADEVTNVLFSSGTTGEPKAIPWTHVTPLRCAVDGWAQLDVRPGSVLAWPTSMGWMMGPWLLYAGLMNGATIALYGGAPLGRDFLQFVSAARVDVLGLVPSIVRAWRNAPGYGPGGAADGTGGGTAAAAGGGVDLSCVRVFGSTGEASAAEDYHWLMSRGRGYRPVVEYCGGTEIGGAYASSTPLHACAPSTFTTATLGARLVLLAGPGAGGGDETNGGATAVWDGAPTAAAGPSVAGEVALAMPMLGVSQRLLNKDHFKVYYEGMPVYGTTGLPLRRHGDEMAALPSGGPGPAPWSFCALGRCDDTMNLGGIKVSSVELERAVMEAVDCVAEAAAVGIAPSEGGPEELYLFLVLKHPPTDGAMAGAAGSSSGNGGASVVAQEQETAVLHQLCQEAIRRRLNPLFKVTRVAVVAALPRNASNKIMRRVLRDMLPRRSRL